MQRTKESQARVELSFDCGDPSARFGRASASSFGPVTIREIGGSSPKTTLGSLQIEPGYHAIAFNIVGTLIARSTVREGLVLAPPASIAFIRGGIRLNVTAARGDHQVRILTWPGAMLPFLERWVDEQTTVTDGPPRAVACRPIAPQFSSACDRLQSAIAGPPRSVLPLVTSVIYEVAALLLSEADSVKLAGLPRDLPPTLESLTRIVRQDPSAPWPLKEAADFAGYSAFYFSRVFKQTIGYGFHEYVDRSRTERAVEMLCTTNASVELVASSCGYGTTQGLRDSVREYLGVVPSELRALAINES